MDGLDIMLCSLACKDLPITGVIEKRSDYVREIRAITFNYKAQHE